MSARVLRTRRSVFRAPLLLAALTLLGLFAALLGEAALWHWAAWLALGVPVVVIAWKLSASLARLRAHAAERTTHHE
jgi:hypothetical protein